MHIGYIDRLVYNDEMTWKVNKLNTRFIYITALRICALLALFVWYILYFFLILYIYLSLKCHTYLQEANYKIYEKIYVL